ncbi:MAG: DUF4097 domain-containing protein [Candidatus Edwardsbacteria bacterium]|nr:DUF4097 domain-containing protein [Candidatus Edwardsbacteria bacterium]MBU1577712.1 DUF4097 domain-containing protein [Candidatus Edwardsbacteria bacterium]MBU2464238.1 DUF4097 domain-containing protein [Candidatus Edwardsbacteria bacterium]MBU2593530.1 DUF4097 domain-containing protein [Candidatus Edwardsbacteria bacterium]
MSQETVKILKMLEDGKISSQEANSLLSALGGSRHRHAFKDLNIDHSQLKEEMDILRDNIHHINPGRIVAEAMAGVKEGLQGLKGLKGLKDIHIEMDDLRGSEKAEEEKVITVPAQGVTILSVSQPRSDFEITGTDGDQINIRADIQVWAEEQDEAEEKLRSLDITTENDSGTLRIKLDGPPWTKKRRTKVDFTIEMPRHITAEISSASGDITVSGLHKGARLNTASGDISVSDCIGELILSSASGEVGLNGCQKAKIKINTASGDIQMSGAEGEIAFQTVSGDVSASLSGNVQGQTVSGGIDIKAEKPGEIKINSTSGDVRFQGPLSGVNDSAIATVSGDVSLGLEKGSSAMIEAGTVSGDIDCGLELAGSRQSSRSLSGKLGDGQGSLKVKTVSGDIEIN